MPINVTFLVESITVVIVGSLVSLLNRFVFTTPSCTLSQYCKNAERETSESDQ